MTEDTKNLQDKPTGSEDKVGELIRKQRITKRISIETIARDLKVNDKYIKAIEEGRFGELPAEAYVRVYLVSISKYLGLDQDKVIKQFFREQGIVPERKKSLTDQHAEVSGMPQGRSGILYIIVGGAFVLMVLIGFFSNRFGLIGGSSENLSDSLAIWDEVENENSPNPQAAQTADTLEPIVGPEDSVIATSEDTIPSDAALRLLITAEKDSSWLQVFTDGESWKNVLDAGATRTFFSNDSINIHVGNNASLKYVLNGKPLTPSKAAGVLTFKIDRDEKVSVWTLKQWNDTFKDRL